MAKNKLIFIYDSETSYISKSEMTKPKGERERYADGIYLRNIDGSPGILFNDGKETMSNFLRYIFRVAKQYSKTHDIKIGVHNLKYDISYIIYFLNKLGYFNESSLHNISIDTIDDGNMIYQCTICYNYRTKGKNKKGETTFRSYKIEFFDTYKLFPISVKKMGKSLTKNSDRNLEKGDFDYNKVRD